MILRLLNASPPILRKTTKSVSEYRGLRREHVTTRDCCSVNVFLRGSDADVEHHGHVTLPAVCSVCVLFFTWLSCAAGWLQPG